MLFLFITASDHLAFISGLTTSVNCAIVVVEEFSVFPLLSLAASLLILTCRLPLYSLYTLPELANAESLSAKPFNTNVYWCPTTLVAPSIFVLIVLLEIDFVSLLSIWVPSTHVVNSFAAINLVES